MKVTDFVMNSNLTRFHYYREGYMYYIVHDTGGQTYMFPISIEDVKGATLNSVHRAIELMRWIRKAIEDGTMVSL